MFGRVCLVAAFLVTSGSALAQASDATGMTATGLRCEYMVNPLGIGAAKPRLRWTLQSPQDNQRQTAYQVLVASDPAKLARDEGDLWDSGKVDSDRTNQVEYQGKPLGPEMRCHWKVRAWDKDGAPSPWSEPAFWSMGLLEKSDWQAKWIGYETPDERLTGLQGCKWVWYPEGDPRQSAPVGTIFLHKTVDLPADRTIRSALFTLTVDDEFVLRVNGAEAGKEQGVKDGWRQPAKIDVTGHLKGGPNVLAIEAANTTASPAGVIGRLVVRFEQGEPLSFAIDGSWKVAKERVEGWEQAGFDAGGWAAAKELAALGEGPWGAIGDAQQMLPAPFFRKEFAIDAPIRRATLYATALGIYEVSINGKRVGRDVLTPGWSDYRKRVYYFTYDATDLVKSGKNAVGAILGDGWYGSYLAFTGKRRFYGGAPRLMLQLCVEMADGTRKVIGTDETWKAGQGPIVYADLLMGESRDLRKEMPGWDTVGFDDGAWKAVTVSDDPPIAVEPHPGLPIRPQEELPAQTRNEPRPGVYVYDLGQNMVGWVRLRVTGEAGQKVTVRHAEMLNPDGTLYTANLRAARATDTYILPGGPQAVICEPSMTFHGFRYVEVTGAAAPPAPEDVVGIVVHSDIPRTCWFECSNPLVNKLVENIQWGQKGNYLDIPTDCPQRDERAGWTADAQVFTKTAAFNRDVSAFFTKWLVDLCEDGQRDDGAYPDVAPSILGHGNAAWEDAAVICTYHQYEMYGDTRVIERYYDRLVHFMDHLAAVSKGHLRPAGAYGDWLLLAGPQKSDLHGTAYYYYCATLMAEMARAIGKPDDAKRFDDLAGKIKEAFVKAFIGADGTIRDKDGTSQTFYALPFALDLVPEQLRTKAAEHFVELIRERDWHLATGFLGTPVLLPALEKIDRADVAYRILLCDTYPSWLSQVKLGSTTMWERWDGWLPDKGFQNPGMNSFNHYWLGCVGEWLYTRVAGIDTVGPGFRKIVIRPVVLPKSGITSAKARYDAISGKIQSGWKLAGGRLTLEVTIPVNTSATVYVPTTTAAAGQPDVKAPSGAKFIGVRQRAAVYEIGSGTYVFSAAYAD